MGKKYKIEKSETKKRWDMLGIDDNLLDIDMIKGPHTEIFDNNRINIDGCMGVEEYNDTYVKLKLNRGMLILYGTKFNILFFENRTITISGKISSIEFCV